MMGFNEAGNVSSEKNDAAFYETPIALHRTDITGLQAYLCFGHFAELRDLEAVVERDACLHPQEESYLRTLRFDRRRKSYLLGRLTAKHAVAGLSNETVLSRILIQPGVFTQPVVISGKQNIQVSITHGDDLGAAMAFPEVHPMGIDLEKVDADQTEVLRRQVTAAEFEMLKSWQYSEVFGLTLFWTAKEALSKVLKTGLTSPLRIFELENCQWQGDYLVSNFKNFQQYQGVSFTIGQYFCSIVYPFKTDWDLDIKMLQEQAAFWRL